MARRLTATHHRIDEIDRALRNGVSYRPIAEEFGVSLAALSRRAATIGVDRRPASLSDSLTTSPHAAHTNPNSNPSAPACEGTGSAATPPPDDALFDVLSLSYPWREGEPRNPDPRADQLRGIQRRYGTEAVRAEVLALMGDFRRMDLSPHTFARSLDVPPATIQRWLAARSAHDQELLLHTDASVRVSRDYADMSDAIASIDKKLAHSNLGDRVFGGLMAQKTKLIEQRAKLTERHGLDQIHIDSRDRGAQLIHEGMADCFGELNQLCSSMKSEGITFADLFNLKRPVRERRRPPAD